MLIYQDRVTIRIDHDKASAASLGVKVLLDWLNAVSGDLSVHDPHIIKWINRSCALIPARIEREHRFFEHSFKQTNNMVVSID